MTSLKSGRVEQKLYGKVTTDNSKETELILLCESIQPLSHQNKVTWKERGIV